MNNFWIILIQISYNKYLGRKNFFLSLSKDNRYPINHYKGEANKLGWCVAEYLRVNENYVSIFIYQKKAYNPNEITLHRYGSQIIFAIKKTTVSPNTLS